MPLDLPAQPRAPRADQTLRLLAEGYDFIPKLVGPGRRWVETRLMLRRAVCISGGDAAEVLYEPDRFTRVGALPPTTLRLLQGAPSVNQLDGEAHRYRKRYFMAVLNGQSVSRLVAIFQAIWRKRMQAGRQITLLDEAERVLCEAACLWADLPQPPPRELKRRTSEFAAMVGCAGAAGPELVPALILRQRNELWARRLIHQVRAGHVTPSAGSPLAEVAAWTDEDGRLLDVKTAAVELINLLRPTVAVARYIVFAAHALHQHPEWRARAAEGQDAVLEAFAMEVRRLYPFFPAVGGKVLRPFEWSGRAFAKGEWVLGDLHGANHDPERWNEPERFEPARFLEDSTRGPLVTAQGAGEPAFGHRCPGERATMELIKAATFELARADYVVPEQNLSIPLSRMPTAPASGFVMRLGAEPSRGWSPMPGELVGSRTAVVAFAMGSAFVALGAFAIAAPRALSRLIGMPASRGAWDHVRMLGFRDIGVGVALGLASRGSPNALAALTTSLALIPVADGLFVAGRRGRAAWPSLLVHTASAASLLALALASHRQIQSRREGTRRRLPG